MKQYKYAELHEINGLILNVKWNYVYPGYESTGIIEYHLTVTQDGEVIYETKRERTIICTMENEIKELKACMAV